MKVRCFYNVPWFWGKFFKGFTLYPFIFFKEDKKHVTETLFRHEWEHVRQIRQWGWFRFYWRYLIENIKVGYEKNKYEQDAYLSQHLTLTPHQKRTFDMGREM